MCVHTRRCTHYITLLMDIELFPVWGHYEYCCVNIPVHDFWYTCIHFSLNLCVRVELRAQGICLCSISLANASKVFQVVVPISTLTHQCRRILISPNPLHFLVSKVIFNFRHCGGNGVTFYVVPNLYFPEDLRSWALFHMFVGHLDITFWEAPV